MPPPAKGDKTASDVGGSSRQAGGAKSSSKKKSRKLGARGRGKPGAAGADSDVDSDADSHSDTDSFGPGQYDSGAQSGSEDGPPEVHGAIPIASISSSSALEPTEVEGLEAIRAWLADKCSLTPRSAQKYAALLFLDKGCASVEALAQRVARNRAYLTEAGVDADDAQQISAALSTLDAAHEEMREWLGRCGLTPVKAAHYTQLLYLEKGCASVKALGKRLERNPKYLVDVAGVDPDDAEEIVKVLRGKKGVAAWGWRK